MLERASHCSDPRHVLASGFTASPIRKVRSRTSAWKLACSGALVMQYRTSLQVWLDVHLEDVSRLGAPVSTQAKPPRGYDDVGHVAGFRHEASIAPSKTGLPALHLAGLSCTCTPGVAGLLHASLRSVAISPKAWRRFFACRWFGWHAAMTLFGCLVLCVVSWGFLPGGLLEVP